jgi:hypothetical protein
LSYQRSGGDRRAFGKRTIYVHISKQGRKTTIRSAKEVYLCVSNEQGEYQVLQDDAENNVKPLMNL